MAPSARALMDSNGGLHDNAASAAEAVGLKSPSNIYEAAIVTRAGAYKIAGRRQWAFIGEVPDKWPEKPVKPIAPERTPSRPRPTAARPMNTSSNPILPPEIEGVEWRVVSGLPDIEVSNKCRVRFVECQVPFTHTPVRLAERRHGKISVVEIDGYSYKCLDLMCHAFMGFIPYGFVRRQRRPGLEYLSNVFYEQRKPRTSPTKDSK